LYRFAEELDHKNFKDKNRVDSIDTYWDDDYDLADPGGWEHRHNHEANIIAEVIAQLGIKKVLELGSGPGNLATKIIDKTGVDYTLVDGDSALRAHAKRNNKGKLLVIDLFDSFDTTNLDSDYDLVVANDFLEHIRNPSLILEKVRNDLTTDTSWFFLSSPNWRMKHQFYYPGLFDYDNLVKFMIQEGYKLHFVFDSWANHVPVRVPRLNSESSLPEGHLFDWNHYLLFKKEV
jgi:2-polyprenyl-3-methyl-5-hydroxy-6-metoxy-1,4-benzoquinol methylase